MVPDQFNAYVVAKDSSGSVVGNIQRIRRDELPEGEVTIRVQWSSLNYKDALAAQGHPGVAGKLPHVPGIDAAGEVVESSDAALSPGDSVLVTGYELGAGQWGGWSQYIRVPAAWIVPLPDQLTARESMIYGTAGFTAAQCVSALVHAGVDPSSGPIVVTGATGGVGCLAIKILSRLGYSVVASSGKADAVEWLRDLGAEAVVSREDVLNASDRPLARARWAGGVDTVGGQTLASLLRASQVCGCIAACGLVGGADLPLTVYPFILRGVTLAGITSQNCEMDERRRIWQNLAGDWRLTDLDEITHQVPLADLVGVVEQIKAGKIRGRVIVQLGEA